MKFKTKKLIQIFYVTLVRSPGIGYFIRALIFRAIIGAQQAASVNTMKKNLKANSESPTDKEQACLVFQILANIPA